MPSRLLTPRPSAPTSASAAGRATTAASARLGPGGRLPPRRRQRVRRCLATPPFPLSCCLWSPRVKLTQSPRGLDCDMAAGIPPSRHTSPSLRHASLPPCQPRRAPPHSGPHAPNRAGEDGDRVGQSCGRCSRGVPKAVIKRQEDVSEVSTTTETRVKERDKGPNQRSTRPWSGIPLPSSKSSPFFTNPEPISLSYRLFAT